MHALAIHRETFAGLAADDLGHDDRRAPLVLLHGLSFDRTMWRPALRDLASIDPGRRVVAVDLPGHGDSPDEAAYDLASTVGRIHDVVLAAGLDAPVLVGHSASAGTVATYAAQHPTRGIVEVEGTVDVAPFARL